MTATGIEFIILAIFMVLAMIFMYYCTYFVALVFCVCSTCVCVVYKLLAIGGFVYVCTCVSVFFGLLVFPLVCWCLTGNMKYY